MIAIGDYTISEIYDGESIQGDAGATISTSTEQYYLSDYNNRLSGGSWSDTEPSSIPSGKYLWGRWKFVMTDGTTQYSDAVYRSTIQGIESKVNTLDNSITNKVWQTDINNSISSYDGSTVSAIRNRVSQNEQDIDGIETNISNMSTTIAGKADGSTVTQLTETVNSVKQTADGNKSTVSNLTTTLGTNTNGTTKAGDIVHRTSANESSITQTANSITSLVSNQATYTKPDGTTGTNTIHSAIQQNADNINLKVDKNGVIAAINLSTETDGGSTAKISADKVNIEGATIFTSGRLSSESLNNTYDPKGSIYDSGNMLLDAYAPSLTKINAKYNRYFSDASNTSTTASFVSAGSEVLPDPNAKYFVRIKNTVVYNSSATDKGLKGLAFYSSGDYVNGIGMVVGDTYRASCWVRQLEGGSNFAIGLGGFVNSVNFSDSAFVPTAEWRKYEKVFTFSDYKSTATTVWSRLYFINLAGFSINGAGTGIGQIDMCGFKLERINAIATSGRNLCLRSADYNRWGKNNGTTFDGNIINFPTVTADTWREAWQNNNVSYSTVRNQKVTVTYKVKGTSGDLIQSFVCFSLVATATDSSRLKYVNKYVTLTANGEWQTVAFSVYINDYVFTSGTGTPDYDNCYFMIRVGATGAADGRNGFQMKEIMVALGSDPCAWSPAPEDGIAQEQRIYYRTNTTSAPNAPSTWVASTTTANDTWTTKRMQYDKDYPYLFTCIQRQAIGGTITNTEVLLDDTTTVIDGGNIITGSVTTNQLATDAIKSLEYTEPTNASAPYSVNGTFFNLAGNGEFISKNFAIDNNGNAYFRGRLSATALTVEPGATFDGDIDQFKGASFGWNLVRGTNALASGNGYWSTGTWRTTGSAGTVAYNQDIADSPVASVTKGITITATTANSSIGITQDRCPIRKEQITQSVWVKGSAGDKVRLQPIWSDTSGATESGAKDITLADGNWTRIEWSKTPNYAHDSVSLCYIVYLAKTAGTTLTVCCPKMEYGSLASEWCPAEDEVHGVDGKDGISAVGLAMKVNYSAFATANSGECYFHGFDANNAEADVDGWVMWNGSKLTITKGMWINSNSAAPYNTVILHVFRTSTEPYHADVWWDSSLSKWRGYMYLSSNKTPGTIGDWVWNEATDCILATYIEPSNEGAITSAQLFTTPKKFSELPDPDNIQNIVNTSIDGIEIGGRNLLQGTANPQISASYDPPYYNVRSGGDGVGSIESIEDSPVTGITKTFRITGNTTGNRDFVQLVEDFSTLWTDGQWMFSCYARGIGGNANVYIRVYTGSANTFVKTIPVQTTWARIECPIKLNGTGSQSDPSHMQFGITGAGSIEYIAPMLERGTKASAWSPAPEDIQGSIDSVNNTISGVRGDLTQTQGDLSRIDGAVTNLDGQIQTTYELASGAKSSADEANQKYDAISSIVNDYNNLRNYYLDFNPTPSGISGLIIGARNSDGSDNAFKTQITNDSLNFLQNGSAVAGINANEFFINQGTIETGLRVGNFVIFDEDGALNIKYEPRLEA